MYNYLESGVRMPTFRERFLFLKTEKEVTLEQIARACNTNKASLSKVVSGQLNLKKDLIESLANYFGVDQGYLLGETDTRKNNEKLPGDYIEVCKLAINNKVSSKVLKGFLKLYVQDFDE